MKYARLSLFYISTYLTLGGLGFLFVPEQFGRLLFSNTVYQDIPLRLAGMFSLIFGILVFQVARYAAEKFYNTSILIRLIALAILLWLYTLSNNPLFVSIMVIVGVGLAFTVASLAAGRNQTQIN
jgi:uncharacterized protein YjeT (DUF2065 family)